jgi:predicted RNase H-like HicB family nuclease
MRRSNSEPQITLEQSDDGSFFATCSSLPGFVARGDTEGAAIRKIKRALKHSFEDQRRDFIRITEPESRGEFFRWSRWRAPLYLRLPLSRGVKMGLAAFGAGLVMGATAITLRKRLA